MSTVSPTIHRFAVRKTDGRGFQKAVSNRTVGCPNRAVGASNRAVGRPNDGVGCPNVTVARPNVSVVVPDDRVGFSSHPVVRPNRIVGSSNHPVGSPNGLVGDRKCSAAPPSGAGRTGMLPVTSGWGILPQAQASGPKARSTGDRWHTCPTDNSEQRTANHQ